MALGTKDSSLAVGDGILEKMEASAVLTSPVESRYLRKKAQSRSLGLLAKPIS